MLKKLKRLRRSKRTRARIKHVKATALTVHRTSQHIYAQIISAEEGTVLASASTLEKEVRGELPNGGNVNAAKKIGELIAKRAQEKGVTQVAFDRSGFKYHGRVKALAEAARENGLQF